MFTHDEIWKAIDALAQRHGYSPSGLAKKAGLDPTTFNKSKRTSAEGKPRWPSTESISKILSVTGENISGLLGSGGNSLKEGEPVAVQTRDGKMVTGVLLEQTADKISLNDAGGNHQSIKQDHISWMAHIVMMG